MSLGLTPSVNNPTAAMPIIPPMASPTFVRANSANRTDLGYGLQLGRSRQTSLTIPRDGTPGLQLPG